MKLNKINIIIILASVVVGTLIGFFLNGSSDPQHEQEGNSQNMEAENQIWTCSMHPSVRQNEPGDCPICGMDLIPLSESDNQDGLSANAVSMSSTAMKLASVETATVEKAMIEKEILVAGKLQENENQEYTQSAHFPGRVEELYVNYEGEFVRKGQIIGKLYSPELLTAQEELLLAYKQRENNPSYYEAAQQKLQNWKLSNQQIQSIIEAGKVKETFNIISDFSGYISKLNITEGKYLNKGEPLFELDNLSKLWVYLDVYEQDIQFVKLGSEVKFHVQSFPSKEFTSKIDFISPKVDPISRIVKVRANIQNGEGLLKPEMLVTANIQFKQFDSSAIIVPKSSVMWTGKRSVVYVKEETQSGISFTMREVDLGLALNDSFVVTSGLNEGEVIAVAGTFSIDAAAQLAGKPSMMSAKKMESVELSQEAKLEFKPLFDSYFELKDALIQDDFSTSISKSKELKLAFQNVDMEVFRDDSHELWMGYHKKMQKILEHIQHQEDIEGLRKNFIALSDWMIQLTKTFKPHNETLYLQHCPMADNNKGADWLSREKPVMNPYFGSSMLSCGEVTEVL
ncbi:efflux RND transporter periplasmic adaptor subunit [Marivirga arenosa]|uniref:Efflux RND transporter periplasmic adaptor subunit n=1 Tax=Marivirga arenosa TaxID=3059076 RepID=A0AA49JHA8_9BACT|nr:efflux RND transporter periplasmic adaptor subunit [Marivirga sp. BKB1-2]WKK79287.2 efflux RND transporter periplasmic adaptor subunit [Marivirga sp. BKB1-2]